MLWAMLLEKYYLTHLPFPHIPVAPWMDSEDFITYSMTHQLSTPARLTLLYDRALVKLFRALFLSDVSVEVKGQKEVSIGLEMAKFLDSREGAAAIIRDAWLKCNEKRLVYAHTVIDTSSIGDPIKREINRKNKPVGTLLNDYNVPVMRDQLSITQIKSDFLAEYFSIIEDILWARCYRLRSADGFNAAVLEVFSSDTWKTAS